MRAEAKTELAGFRCEVQGKFANPRSEIGESKAEIIQWAAGLTIAQTAVLGVIIKLVR